VRFVRFKVDQAVGTKPTLLLAIGGEPTPGLLFEIGLSTRPRTIVSTRVIIHCKLSR